MALLIAGTNSGCGKSTVTLGVLSAFMKLGCRVQAFKAGPDFIDAGLHGLVTGRPSRNLDLYMCGADYVRGCLLRYSSGTDAAVIEGVMGLYDGGERSTAVLAKTVDASVVLVVNAYGMAESAGAILKGFAEYGGRIDGVIFNNVGSERHYERLKAATGNVEPLGYLPRDPAFRIPERHLGLLTAEESPIDKQSLERLTDSVMSHINVNRLMKMARPQLPVGSGLVGSEFFNSTENNSKNSSPSQFDSQTVLEAALKAPSQAVRLPNSLVRVAVARDRAFCFYYEDNLDMLREAGSEIVPFSPLGDSVLPEAVSALYLGGGYPEIHAGELSENKAMASAIREWAESGRPVYAECGGLMYLGEGITVRDAYYPMAGVFPFRSVMREKAAALGYRDMRAGEDCLICKKGDTLKGHEFHYSEVAGVSAKNGVRLNVFSEEGDRVVSAAYKSTLASYVHVHFGSGRETAAHFISRIRGT